MVKLLMGWDIRPGQEEAYFEFLVNEFAPRLAELGIKLTEAWYTAYGNGPQILAGGVAKDMETMKRILESEEWEELKKELLLYVTNFRQKLVSDDSYFQL